MRKTLECEKRKLETELGDTKEQLNKKRIQLEVLQAQLVKRESFPDINHPKQSVEDIDSDEKNLPPPPPPPVVNLSDIEDDDNIPPEIFQGPDCHTHPLDSPVLPFAVAYEKDMPAPTLQNWIGRVKDGRKALVIRMECKINNPKNENMQYRVFVYLDIPTEEKRRWKQLSCIKVQSGLVLRVYPNPYD